jgi:hypothetical protein
VLLEPGNREKAQKLALSTIEPCAILFAPRPRGYPNG